MHAPIRAISIVLLTFTYLVDLWGAVEEQEANKVGCAIIGFKLAIAHPTLKERISSLLDTPLRLFWLL